MTAESVEFDVGCVRAAKNQSLFREVNEKIGELSGLATFATFICECMDATCDQQVLLTREEYEGIRSDSNSFFVVPGHENREVEEIVDVADRYVAVAKLGAGAAVANGLDPRRRRRRL